MTDYYNFFMNELFSDNLKTNLSISSHGSFIVTNYIFHINYGFVIKKEYYLDFCS